MDGFASREQVLADLFSRWTPSDETELVPLDESIGRITTCELFSVNTLPVYRTSACDGIAVKSELFKNGMPDYKMWHEGVEFERADTGDDFDDRYDAVIMIEEVDLTPDGMIKFISEDIDIVSGTNTTAIGSSIVSGEFIIGANMPIRPSDLAALAMGACCMVPVRRKPRIAFIPTGTELIPPQMRPKRGQNIDTNSLLVRETLRALGAEPVIFPIIIDDNELLEKTLDAALLTADIVVLNGGTAKGGEDYNAALIERKGQLLHHYVAAAPGRPMAVSMINDKPVINLPGPTIAAFFGADWCLSAIVCRALHIPVPQKERVVCTLTQDIDSSPTMAILCRIEVKKGEDGYVAEPRSFRSGTMPSCLTSNAMYVSPIGESKKKAGEKIEVELLRGREFIH
ncbi:molybdopterin molybdotransferase MoeA [Anaerovorax odorimutans]|uniref:molybdopterin molybdotransferase MoeA n=1 Tax=Anaerovorax odorimutans TaxID=109327 RepID=UPI00041F5F13|nr:molybdopterin molybdotransferase MoeA [Anaerovorax odorimutans]